LLIKSIFLSAQLILQRLKNVDLSTVNLDILISHCSEIPVIYLKVSGKKEMFFFESQSDFFLFRNFCQICI